MVYLRVGAGKMMNTLFSSNSDDAVCADWILVLAQTFFSFFYLFGVFSPSPWKQQVKLFKLVT